MDSRNLIPVDGVEVFKAIGGEMLVEDEVFCVTFTGCDSLMT